MESCTKYNFLVHYIAMVTSIYIAHKCEASALSDRTFPTGDFLWTFFYLHKGIKVGGNVYNCVLHFPDANVLHGTLICFSLMQEVTFLSPD